MKRTILRSLIASVLLGHLALVAGCAHPSVTSQRVSGPESNFDGSTSVGRETTTDQAGTTTTVRERTTTNLDGTVRNDRETRTIVEGGANEDTFNTTSESTQSMQTH